MREVGWNALTIAAVVLAIFWLAGVPNPWIN